jgi:hypothetical protein
VAAEVPWTQLLGLASGVLLVALGLSIAHLRPRRRGNLALAAFAGLFGLSRALRNGLTAVGVFVWAGWYQPAMEALAWASMAYVVLAVPRRVASHEHHAVRLAAACGVLACLGKATQLAALPDLARAEAELLRMPVSLAAEQASWVVQTAGFGFQVFALLLPAMRFAGTPGSAQGRPVFALIAAAQAAWLGVTSGVAAIGVVQGVMPASSGPGVGVDICIVALAGGLWLRNAARSSGLDASLARNVALLGFASLTFGAAAQAVNPSPSTGGPPLAVARVGMVLLIAYGILRHQLLGIDVKVKWTLRQSTVAAAFIGVFFVVSEGATTFFQQSGLGPYLGIAAAGLLVFAMAPLQRAAERVASAAMPGVKGVAEMDEGERAAFYREQLALAWADGILDAGERAMLEAQRRRLGLSQERAHDLEREVMQQRIAAGGPT